jgi:hypothetical protein
LGTFAERKMSGSTQSRIRVVSWLLHSVRIRQTARKAFDLTYLGSGSAERLCSALILGAAFVFVVLLLGHLAQLKTAYVLAIAVMALVSVIVTCGILVLWKTDRELENEVPQLKKKLAELREVAAEERSARQAEETQRVVTVEARPNPRTKRLPLLPGRDSDSGREMQALRGDSGRRFARGTPGPTSTTLESGRCCRAELLLAGPRAGV